MQIISVIVDHSSECFPCKEWRKRHIIQNLSIPLEFPNIMNRSKLYKQGKSYRSHTRAIKSVYSYLAFYVRAAKCLTTNVVFARRPGPTGLQRFANLFVLAKLLLYFTVYHMLLTVIDKKRENDSSLIVSGFIGTIGMEIFRQTYPLKIMKSAVLPHSMEVITLGFFA